MTRGRIERRLFENRNATATMTTSPSSPVNRCMRTAGSAHDFENQSAFFGRAGGDAERALDQLGGFFHQILARVVQAAENAAGVDLLADLDLQNHAHGGI